MIAEHHAVAECGVVGMPHPIKGESLVAFITLKQQPQQTIAAGGPAATQLQQTVLTEIRDLITLHIGKLALPDVILFTADLPKTRSGKVMRRLLRNIAIGKTDKKSMGDTSTLADPSVIDTLIQQFETSKKQQQ